MKDVFEAIHHRRSVRSYLTKPVPRELIERILDAGNWAPTGNNYQAWRFVVVQDEAFIEKLKAATLPTWDKIIAGLGNATDASTREYFADFGPRCLGWTDTTTFEGNMERLAAKPDGVYWGAPVIIFCIGTRGHADWECSAVCQNMMLAADALGLGSCWSGFGSFVTVDEEVVAMLELKENEKLLPAVVVGYPAIQPDPPPKKDPVVKWI